ncbi:glycosyltransferase family 4 protein [Endozoicomonas ascidiicola]|uniref:glycosyltransferase family 4 protein n=1 Tax=Endozoicomonas ascidiicola TaxID=1698521 RepID=UPI00083337A9|nr:glycosyltransferase family 4 protein [Endozoicomonas ascidiicola]
MKQPINLTIATDIDGMGGIATVLNVYRECGFFSKWNIRLIPTHSSKKALFGLNRLFLYLFALLKVAAYQLFCNVGLVHIHMASRGSYLRKSLLVRLVKSLGGKVILHLHGAEFRDFYSKECNKNKQNQIKNTFEMADAVIVLSTQWLLWAKETLNRSEHVLVIYNAVPSLQVNHTKSVPGLVVFLGRIGHRKGAIDLIRTFAHVKTVCPYARLALAGDGDIDTAKIEAESLGLLDSVDFLGWISGSDKEELLSRADLYCLPSYNEGFPMGVLEAMSAGVPIVASRAGGIPDAIEHKKEGLLIDAGDIDGLAQALITVIDNRQMNAEYARAGNQKFQENFSLDAVIPQLDALYSKLLNS